MPITIRGIKLNAVHIELNLETGGYKIGSAEYSLISSTDKVLAKQPIGGYGGMVLEPSPETRTALEAFVASYVHDMQATLGLDSLDCVKTPERGHNAKEADPDPGWGQSRGSNRCRRDS